MNVTYTSHALYRMQERSVTGAKVKEVLNSYTKKRSYDNGFNLSKNMNGKTLIIGVIYNEANVATITTVFWKGL